jgi:hypothetical protein
MALLGRSAMSDLSLHSDPQRTWTNVAAAGLPPRTRRGQASSPWWTARHFQWLCRNARPSQTLSTHAASARRAVDSGTQSQSATCCYGRERGSPPAIEPLSPRLPICNEGWAPDFAKTVKPPRRGFISRAESVAKRGGKNESTARRYHLRALRARGVEPRGPRSRKATVKAITLSARKS